jgi:hypothetical protein
MENTYIRTSDGLIMHPVVYENNQGERIINYSLYTYWNSEEPPITINELKLLGFIPLKELLN